MLNKIIAKKSLKFFFSFSGIGEKFFSFSAPGHKFKFMTGIIEIVS